LKIRTIGACDLKTAARRFIANNYKTSCEHLYPSFHHMARHKGCTFHESCDHGDLTHCFYSGFPCQAWTRQRFGDKVFVSPSEHSGWLITFRDVFSYLDAHEVHGGVMEQVAGFMDRDTKSPPEALQGHTTPHDLCIAMLRSRGFATRTLHLNMKTWIKSPPRDRIWIVYVDETLGGEKAAEWIESASEDSCSMHVLSTLLR
jgi:hypothetical protein